MKKILFVLILIITVIIGITIPAYAERIKYSGVARTSTGTVLGTATVSTYLAGTTTPAGVYTASSGGAAVYSVTSDTGGRFTFYVDTADYGFVQQFKVVATKDGYETVSLDNIYELQLPTDAAGYLRSNGAGAYSWADSPSAFLGDGSTTKGNVKLYDLDNSAYVAITPADETTSWTMTLPAATSTVANQLMIFNSGTGSWLTPTNHCFVSGNLDSTEMECKTPANAYAAIQAHLFDADADGDQDTMTDEHLVCVNVSGATYGLKDCGAKVTDNSTASHAVYKDSSGYMADQVLTIDAHAASTTITLIPGICPIIHNASQADADINNTLPAVGAGKCFVALATSAEADKYWRLTAAAANTICLNRTCGKDYIQFATPAVGDTFTCMSDGTNWYCYDRDSDAEAGDL